MKLIDSLLMVSLMSIGSLADQVELKKGWNLIGIDSTDPVSILSKNTHILKAAGGGVGGGGDFKFDMNFANYAQGVMKLGQGYWIKTDADTKLTYTKTSSKIDAVELKKGWNLINSCVELNASKLFDTYPHIVKAAGGGVGGGGDFRYDRKYAKYAQGVTKESQGYWFYADDDFKIKCDANSSTVSGVKVDADDSVKLAVEKLLKPSSVADVSDAKNLFTNLRELSTSFVDFENDVNNSTVIDTHLKLLEKQIQPKVEDIASDLNVSANAMQKSVDAFMSDFKADFETVLNSISDRFDAVAKLVDTHDQNATWKAKSDTFNDAVEHKYSKNGDVITETYSINGMSVVSTWEDIEDGEVKSVKSSGSINFKSKGYSVDVTSLSFDGQKADFKSTARVDGNNSSYMKLSDLSFSFTHDKKLGNTATSLNDMKVNFDGEVDVRGRKLTGKIAVNETGKTKIYIRGQYQGLAKEPSFDGIISSNIAFDAVKTLADIDDELIAEVEKSDAIVMPTYGMEDITMSEPIRMVVYDDGKKSFVTSIKSTYDGNMKTILTTQNSRSLECTQSFEEKEDVMHFESSCRDGKVQDLTGKYVVTTIDGVKRNLHTAYYSIDMMNGGEVLSSVVFVDSKGNYSHADFDTNTSKLMYNGKELVLSDIVELSDVPTYKTIPFDIMLDGSIKDGSKVVQAKLFVSNSGIDSQMKIYGENIKVSDGTNSVGLDKISVVSKMDDIIRINDILALEDEVDIYSFNSRYTEYMRKYYYGDTRSFEYSYDVPKFNFNSNMNMNMNMNNMVNIKDFKDKELKKALDTSDKTFKLENLSASITDYNSNVLKLNASIGYAKVGDDEDLSFDGKYEYKETKFDGKIDAKVNQVKESMSGHIDAVVESSGFRPFSVSSSAVALGDAYDGYVLFSRKGNPTYTFALASTRTSDTDPKVFKFADNNGLVATYIDNSTLPSSSISIEFTDKSGNWLAKYGKVQTGNSWEVVYKDGTTETLY